MIAAVRVRGDIDVSRKVSETMEHLNLEKRNQCVVYEESDAVEGMMNTVKDFVAYGEVSDETVEALKERHGNEIESGTVVNLPPPSKGYKNTKRNVNQGGSLGKRGDMDELISRMV